MGGRYSASDYQDALWRLMPRGCAWAREPGSVQDQVLGALAPSFARTDTRACDLLADAFPATADELLPEWEATLGLPDPCAGPSPTLQQRRAQVGARFANTGGQSAAYVIAFAARLGFAISITEHAAFRAGQSRAGQAVTNQGWEHLWTVNAPVTSRTAFRAGASTAGEPLGVWGNAVLECELKAIQPAHTVLTFSYA